MKKRSIAFFLLLCLAAALLSLPVGAQSSAAVQAAVALGGMDLSDPTEAELTRGQLDLSAVLQSGLVGPFVAGADTQLPFEPVTVYRNESLSDTAEMQAYDVYYYSASARTVWIYTRRAAGRITAVSPSASAPTSVTVAGTSYTFADPAVSAQTAAEVARLLLPSAGEMFYGLLDGSIGSTLWESLASSPASLVGYGLQALADQTDGVLGSVLGYLSEGGSYVCYIDGQSTTVKTSVKYPVLTGGIALRRTGTGTVRSMAQLMPVLLDRLGAASVMSGSTRYETAEDPQVYLWYKGCYYPTTLSQVNAEDYYLVGWYDALGCAAGGRVRVLVAVQKT